MRYACIENKKRKCKKCLKNNIDLKLLKLGIISLFLYKLLLKLNGNGNGNGGNGGGKSPPSIAPTIVSLTPEAYSITIVWTSLSELIASSYNIQRSLDGVNFITITNVPNSAHLLSYTDSMPALIPNTLYYYRINAQNEGGQGPFSSIASITTLPPPPNTWVEKSSGTVGINWLQVVSNNNNTWIATSITTFGVGQQSKLKSTDNGETWTPISVGLFPESLSISAAITFFSFSGTNRFLFLSRFLNSAYYSDNNGVTWTQSGGSLGIGSALWNSVCYGNGIVIGCRSNGNGIGTSHYCKSTDNGLNFAQVLGPIASLNLKSVCYGEPEISSVITPRFVSVGTSGSNQNVSYSIDGTGSTWTNVIISSSPSLVISWNAVCFGNLKYVAVGFEGTNGYVMSSSDGDTWTTPVITFPGTNLNWSSVNFGNGYFVAVSSDTTTNNQIMYSHNGVDWTLVTAPGTPANAWTYVNFSPGSSRWIASDQDEFMVVNV